MCRRASVQDASYSANVADAVVGPAVTRTRTVCLLNASVRVEKSPASVAVPSTVVQDSQTVVPDWSRVARTHTAVALGVATLAEITRPERVSHAVDTPPWARNLSRDP
jgi:hypothetical protein